MACASVCIDMLGTHVVFCRVRTCWGTQVASRDDVVSLEHTCKHRWSRVRCQRGGPHCPQCQGELSDEHEQLHDKVAETLLRLLEETLCSSSNRFAPRGCATEFPGILSSNPYAILIYANMLQRIGLEPKCVEISQGLTLDARQCFLNHGIKKPSVHAPRSSLHKMIELIFSRKQKYITRCPAA